MKLILASNNKNKLLEFREILAGTGIEVIPQSEAGLDEDGLDIIRAMRVFMNSTFYGTDGPGFGDIFADTERDTDTE